MSINHRNLIENWDILSNEPPTSGRLISLNMLIDQCELLGLSKQHTAYVLATVKHETGNKFEPVEEIGKGKGLPYGNPINGKVYYGRGFIQITWQANYQKFRNYFEKIWGVDGNGKWEFDLVNTPELALDPYISSVCTVHGMAKAMFTGKGLSDYGDGDKFDPFNARRTVNGIDRAELIKGYYLRIIRLL